MMALIVGFIAAVTLAPFIVAAVLGTPLPALVAFVTKSTAPDSVKIAVNVIASIAVAVVTVSLVGDSAVISWDTLIAGVVVFLASETSYSTVGKKTGLNDKPWVLPGKGLGS